MKQVYGLVDVGVSRLRTAIVTVNGGEWLGSKELTMDPENYNDAIDRAGNKMWAQARDAGAILAGASIALSAELDVAGQVIQGGTFLQTDGRYPAHDLARKLELSENKVVAIGAGVATAFSQQEMNRRNRRPVSGMAVNLGGSFFVADYFAADGACLRQGGHEFLYDGAMCPCGKKGCANAHISGRGILRNQMQMAEVWLSDSRNREEFAGDVAGVIIQMVEDGRDQGFSPIELRWSGGVAMGQSALVLNTVAGQVRQRFGESAPAFDMVTLGENAVLHGLLVDAINRDMLG